MQKQLLLAAAGIGLREDRPKLARLAIEGSVDVYEATHRATCGDYRANRDAISTISGWSSTMRATRAHRQSWCTRLSRLALWTLQFPRRPGGAPVLIVTRVLHSRDAGAL
jgi:hypothetical protein